MKARKPIHPFRILIQETYGYNKPWYNPDHVFAATPEEAFKKANKRLTRWAKKFTCSSSFTVCVEEDLALRSGVQFPKRVYFPFEIEVDRQY